MMETQDRKNRPTGELRDVSSKILQGNVKKAEAELSTLTDDKFLKLLQNPSQVHRMIFANLPEKSEFVGVHRCNRMVALYFSEGGVLMQEKMSPVEDIDKALGIYASLIEKIFLEKPNSDTMILHLSGALYWFFYAHPFADGNGRTLRFIIGSLCKRLGYKVTDKWTTIDRPYSKHFSYSIRQYPTNPFLLMGALREYFEPYQMEKGVFRGANADCHYDCSNQSSQPYSQCMRDCMGIGFPDDDDDDDDLSDSFLDKLTSWLR